MGYFSYKVKVYSDSEGINYTDQGILFAENCQDATEKLCSWYGEKDILSFTLTYISEDENMAVYPINNKEVLKWLEEISNV